MLRIGDWIKFYPLIPLCGALFAGAEVQQLLLISLIYSALIGYAFVVNNYFDVKIDRQHQKKVECNKNPFASGKVSRRGVQALMFLLVGVTFLSLWLSYLGSVLVLLNLILVTAYSGGPRLKEAAGLDIITHGLMFGAVPFLAGFALVLGSVTHEIIILSAIPFILGCEALIAHQVMDYEMDLGTTDTTITRMGVELGLMLLVILTAISLIILVGLASAMIMPSWAAFIVGWYILAYPAYSCRGKFRDIRHRPSAE